MYARVVTSQFHLEKIDEGVREFRDSVVPRAKQHPGFISALMLSDPSTGKVISLTLWEAEAELKASETDFQESVAKVAQALAGPPTQESYEVSVRA